MHDFNKIKQAISDVDAVISTLAPPLKRKYHVFEVLEGHKNIVKAMKMEKVKRFITIATPSLKSTKDKRSLVTNCQPLSQSYFSQAHIRKLFRWKKL